MDEDAMAAAIAFELNKGCWKAESSFEEIDFTNEDGEKFRLTVEKVEDDE